MKPKAEDCGKSKVYKAIRGGTVAMAEKEGFTNQKRFVATAEDLKHHWGGGRNGAYFRCYMCGHKFAEGDGVRWVYSAGTNFEIDGKRMGVTNPMVCDACDGPDVLDRWAALHREYYSSKFWSFNRAR